MHDKYSKGRVYEINLTNNIDSKLFMKAYIKFLERNGENLDNIITLRSMVYLNQNKKENCIVNLKLRYKCFNLNQSFHPSHLNLKF